MNFASDNAGPVHPRVISALIDANEGHAPAYGAEGAAVATILGELVLGASLIVFLVRSGVGLAFPAATVAKVAAAAALGAAVVLATGTAGVVGVALFSVAYALVLVLSRAVPPELMPALLRRA